MIKLIKIHLNKASPFLIFFSNLGMQYSIQGTLDIKCLVLKKSFKFQQFSYYYIASKASNVIVSEPVYKKCETIMWILFIILAFIQALITFCGKQF